MKMDGSVANSSRIGQLLVVKQRDAIPVARWQGGKGVVEYGRNGAVSDHNTTCVVVLLSV